MMERSPRYDAIARFYDAAVGDDTSDPGTDALLRLVPDIEGARVLDLACGQGRVSRALARRRMSVTGVDLSVELLRIATAREEGRPLGIVYRRGDVCDASQFEPNSVDGVSCNFGLSDIDDLEGALATVAHVLADGGWFVFSVLHPCFPGWDADAPSSWPPEGYYSEGWWMPRNQGFRGKVGATHRTLGTYLNALTRHDMRIDEVAEPVPDADWASRAPGRPAVPVYLVVRSRRSPRHAASV